MDAIDTALVDIDKHKADVIGYQQFPIPKEVQQRVRAVNSTSSIQTVTELDVVLGELFADAVLGIVESSNMKSDDITAIGCHGQTVLHLPEDEHPRTLQIGDANIIAYKTGITTVADFRRMDVAAGGQGAPLASAFHAWQFRQQDKVRVILNIGGMANLTLLPFGAEMAVTGFDSGPGNALMDDWTQRHLGEDYDKNGVWAASGKLNEDLLLSLLKAPFFTAIPPKSTGKDDFNLQWLDLMLDKFGEILAAVDVQATLMELSARSISHAINTYSPDTEEILVCGGGIHNTHLMQRLNSLLAGKNIESTAKHGIDPDALEAIVFAWLAKCRLDEVAGNLPSVTGARDPIIMGALYQPVKSEK